MISLCEVKTLFIYIGLIFVRLIAKLANSFLSSAAIHLSWVSQRMLVAKVSSACIFFGNNLSCYQSLAYQKDKNFSFIEINSFTCLCERCLWHSLPPRNAFSFSFLLKRNAQQIVNPVLLSLFSRLIQAPNEELISKRCICHAVTVYVC